MDVSQLADMADLPQSVGCTGWSAKLWLISTSVWLIYLKVPVV